MTINVGDSIPACTLGTMGKEGPESLTTEQIFGGKKVALFALPGAFTPGCSMAHLPGFVALADKIKAKGVDTIACLSVNDAFVMGAWGEAQNAGEILMLADGNAEFTEKVGLELDATGFGMGKRSQRYSMIVDNGKVTALNIETGKGVEASSAETLLEQL
ncbi:MAG: peroxiredoxin [Gammaproteobacteria bacterium]